MICQKIYIQLSYYGHLYPPTSIELHARLIPSCFCILSAFDSSKVSWALHLGLWHCSNERSLSHHYLEVRHYLVIWLLIIKNYGCRYLRIAQNQQLSAQRQRCWGHIVLGFWLIFNPKSTSLSLNEWLNHTLQN